MWKFPAKKLREVKCSIRPSSRKAGIGLFFSIHVGGLCVIPLLLIMATILQKAVNYNSKYRREMFWGSFSRLY
ncbi:unnamed protein product [Rhizophagus irregularis]|nr:unnamed protein product [Rhizophagus irregularis]CAB4481281.1 unnamed protein product [Rhizophagus irregularis]